MSLKKQAIVGTFWIALNQYSSVLINLIVSIILARLLDPKDFGLIAMIGIFMGIGNILMSSGLGQSLIRSTNPDQEDYSTVFFFNFGGSIIMYLILYFTAPLIAQFYKEEALINIIRVFTISFIINSFSMVQFTRLTKEMDFKTQMKVSIPSLIIGGLLGIIMAYNGYGVWSLVYMTLVSSILGVILIWVRTKWSPSFVFNIKKFKYHFNYGYKLTLAAIIDVIFNNAYVLLIGKYFSTTQVGYYDRANNLKQLPVQNISNIIHKVTFPLFVKIKDNDEKLKDVYQRILKLVIFIVAPIMILMAVLAEPLFRFVLTEKWLPAVPYFQILCINGILFPIHSYNLNVLKVKGRTDLYLKIEIIKKIAILVIISISFQFGIYGLLYGSVVLSIIDFFINTHYTKKILNYSSWEQINDLIPMIISSIFCGFIIYIEDYFLKDFLTYDIVRLITGSMLGVLIYLFIAYLLKMSALNEIVIIIKENHNNKTNKTL
ncbi:lipopolysaccharide biosynthesis protein [Cellulophaga sp. F20128]|uniref:lipopolysaccharide biosynthesis protein n=1 Tax=Cellulophaga sp. F20128 TaxID=2926413 RepID=UPI001FF374B7|nr:lipopolysaccharide biosynthesis protein [Cellulophaga sp. F20128]MCK0156845.1 lipopolysaccharide biosynthesis protein [Cellulophaga sp. F20128]